MVYFCLSQGKIFGLLVPTPKHRQNNYSQYLCMNYAVESEWKAAALSDQFQSMFTRENTSNIPNLNDNDHIAPMPTISFTTSGIQTLLSDIDPNKAQGPDKIAPIILKNCAVEIAPILQVIFEQSLNLGILPFDWLTANICPVFKKGNRKDPSNYRPISLTAPCCKIMEHIIFHSIMDHIQS